MGRSDLTKPAVHGTPEPPSRRAPPTGIGNAAQARDRLQTSFNGDIAGTAASDIRCVEFHTRQDERRAEME